MKIVVFSDVHGNLPALQIMLNEEDTAGGYICLGDTVDYGPWSNECVDLVLSLPNCNFVKGNHEQYFVDGQFDSTNPMAKLFFDVCYPTFTNQQKIQNLPETYTLNGFKFQHTIGKQNIYPDTDIKLDGNYVIGHSHHQFKLEQPPFVLYNAGSVGQNRKYINVINYLTLESDTMNFNMKSIIYDIQPVIKEMISRNYPSECIAYYEGKEILTN
jgi:predicted phosphodiesterase